MATTIQQSFQKLKDNLEISGIFSTRQNSVQDVVKAEIDILDSFLTGS